MRFKEGINCFRNGYPIAGKPLVIWSIIYMVVLICDCIISEAPVTMTYTSVFIVPILVLQGCDNLCIISHGVFDLPLYIIIPYQLRIYKLWHLVRCISGFIWVSLKATNKAVILARAVELSSCCLLKCCWRGLFAWSNVAVTLLNMAAAAVLVALQALSVIVSKSGWGDSGGVRYPMTGCIDLDFKPNLETYYPRFVPYGVT